MTVPRPVYPPITDAVARPVGGGMPWDGGGGGGGIPLSAPVNTVAPVASGTFTLGSTLSTTNGTWTGNPAPTFTYQWKRDGVNIGGATSATYVLVALDMHTTITCDVTGTNALGASTATSNSLTAAKILDLSIGTFTRTSEASYPTGIDWSTMAWAGANVLRNGATLGDDTVGAHMAATYLLENASTNLVIRSEEFDSVSWVKTNTTINAAGVSAPDGDADADALIGTTAGLAASASQAVTGSGVATYVFSVWFKQRGTNTAASFQITDGITPTVVNVTLDGTWRRYQVRLAAAALHTVSVYPHSGGAAGTLANAGDDAYVWGAQSEFLTPGTPANPAAMTSYIRTGAANATRTTDLLTFTDAQIPAAMKTGRSQHAVRVDWLASENAAVRSIFRVLAAASSVWRFETDEVVKVYEGGVVRFQSTATLGLTVRYERHVLVLDLPAGRMYVDGVAQTVGTAFDYTAESGSWAAGAGAATHLFGRLSDVYAC